MAIKRKPHHELTAVKAKFSRGDTVEITRTAITSARALGYALDDIIAVVQALELSDFIKSETAHNPINSKVWHDTYKMQWKRHFLYLKFAGETLVDVTLTSFKEV